ncbi:Neuropeptides capa receptor [Zootermopsis nevadensis]|uniref:Neuropeptides capa receptor n=2 Tax=Zootermopsis nevadensis TaxID=136037 RepID=A0A067QYB7_ZOONE|nr:Neuropeptides capa receptor [Zootermopsis nevadensis]
MSTYTSVLTIVAFSTERYLAICQPIHSYTTSSPRTALRVIAILWCVSLLSATPFAVYTRINYVEYPPGSSYQVAESAFCAMLDQAVPSHWPMYELSALIFFISPMVIIIILYVRMGVTIRSRMIKFPGETKHLDSRTKPIIRMLVAVVITFFLCWAPFHMQRLFYIYGKQSPNFDKINEWAYYITGCFYFFSCTVNPVLYNVMSAKYRLAFRKTLCCGNTDRSSSTEASTFRDTTVIYVNDHFDHCRSANGEEMRRFKSSNRHSRNSDVPTSSAEDITLNNLQYKSSSVKRTSKEHVNINIFDTLRGPHCTGEKVECRGGDSASNKTLYCDDVSDVIISMDVSSNSGRNVYATSKAWPETLKLPRSQSQKFKMIPKPARI